MDERYSRQILFSPIGMQGQLALADKHALIVGAGALGTGIAEMLVRAGVGTLTILDRDYVEWSNLQRQQLYREQDAIEQMPKAVAAKRYLQQINSEVIIHSYVLDANPAQLEQLVDGIDLIMDATDNFATRLILNDVAQKYRIPWIYGACVGSYGITFTMLPDKTPCLNCLLEQMPLEGPTCDTAGIISPAVSMVTSYQTAEALKILTNNPNALRETLVCFDVWKNEHTHMRVDSLKKPYCPSCGDNPTYPYLVQEDQTKTAVLCGRDTVQIRPRERADIDLQQIADQFAATGIEAAGNAFLLSVKLAGKRCVLFKDGRALIHSTKDTAEAELLYQQYIAPHLHQSVQ